MHIYVNLCNVVDIKYNKYSNVFKISLYLSQNTQ